MCVVSAGRFRRSTREGAGVLRLLRQRFVQRLLHCLCLAGHRDRCLPRGRLGAQRDRRYLGAADPLYLDYRKWHLLVLQMISSLSVARPPQVHRLRQLLKLISLTTARSQVHHFIKIPILVNTKNITCVKLIAKITIFIIIKTVSLYSNSNAISTDPIFYNQPAVYNL